ncbi:hypothetical protein ACFTZB_33575 [Rhodococcus sp. NPDC057014]|uniref:hypothetical protein n=1 Tax=Rhodococcus sp. NPDC057014 TaxID=3346000 RepID=UPI00363499D4
MTDIVDGALGMPRGDGADDLTVGENVTVPMEMVPQISGHLGDTGADDELQAGVVEVLEVAGRRHAGVRGDDHLDTDDVVPGLDCRIMGTIVWLSALLPSKQPRHARSISWRHDPGNRS